MSDGKSVEIFEYRPAYYLGGILIVGDRPSKTVDAFKADFDAEQAKRRQIGLRPYTHVVAVFELGA